MIRSWVTLFAGAARAASGLCGGAGVAKSVEIAIRRWAWGQVPTPVSTAEACVVLLANALAVAWLIDNRFRRQRALAAPSTKTGRN